MILSMPKGNPAPSRHPDASAPKELSLVVPVLGLFHNEIPSYFILPPSYTSPICSSTMVPPMVPAMGTTSNNPTGTKYYSWCHVPSKVTIRPPKTESSIEETISSHAPVRGSCISLILLNCLNFCLLHII